MVPVLGREVKEGEQSFPVLGQAGDCLVVPGAVLVGEHINGRLGCRAGRRTIYFTKVCLHIDLDREGNFVQHVGGLVNPTPLVPGTRKDLLDCLPEAERAPAFARAGLPTARPSSVSVPCTAFASFAMCASCERSEPTLVTSCATIQPKAPNAETQINTREIRLYPARRLHGGQAV